jgi:hypothetical protein
MLLVIASFAWPLINLLRNRQQGASLLDAE